jgi:alpha-N-acetylglucosamine transferase
VPRLQHHFPDARIIDRSSADARVLAELANYPRCLEFRKNNHLAPKVFDFASYLESDRMLLLDSDILFFQEPTVLLERIENPAYLLNTVNGDTKSAYTVDPAIVKEKCQVEVIDRFNSGLGLIHKASLNFDWIEEFLALPDILGHFWRIEQTLYALCSSRFGVELLPDQYTVQLEENLQDLPSRHYVGAIRHLMYGEGIRQLVQQDFLKDLKA